MELLTKASAEFSSVAQRARTDLLQLDMRLTEMFETEISKIDQKYHAKYFNYFLNKPTSLLQRAQGVSRQVPPFQERMLPHLGPASQPQPAQTGCELTSGPTRPTLKRSRSAFGDDRGPVGPLYTSGMGIEAEETPMYLHTEASPPCVRPRISANLTPQSPKVTKATPLCGEFLSEPRADDQYSITSYSETDTAEHKAEQDERRRKRRAKKRIPSWCKDWQYIAKMQQQVDPDAIFFTLQVFAKCDLKKIFPDHSTEKSSENSSARASKKKHRGSSGNWGLDGLTDVEINNYKKLMGQIPGNQETPRPTKDNSDTYSAPLSQPTTQPYCSQAESGSGSVFTTNYELSLNITSISSKLGNFSSCVKYITR